MPGQISPASERKFLPAPIWAGEALCSTVDPELFFDRGQEGIGHRPVISNENLSRRLKAKEVCQRCPVMMKCREHYLAEPHGVYGGLDRDERRALREARSLMELHAINPEVIGKQAFELFIKGESIAPLARRSGLKTHQLRTHMETYLQTPKGQRAQLDHAVRKACEDGLDDRATAIKLGIPMTKVTWLRQRMGLAERNLSQAKAKLEVPSDETYVTMGGIVRRAMYLGETDDNPPFFFMRFKTAQAFTRKWMPQDQVHLGQSVTRRVIARGVGSGVKRYTGRPADAEAS